jgi:hypothetical protein
MIKNKKKEQVYKSMREFEEKFFPKSSIKQSAEVSTDARTIGINLAKESLSMIKNQLSK